MSFFAFINSVSLASSLNFLQLKVNNNNVLLIMEVGVASNGGTSQDFEVEKECLLKCGH